MEDHIIVIGNQDLSGILPATTELVGFANRLSQIVSLPTALLVIDPEGLKPVKVPDGCDKVIRVAVSGRPDFTPWMYFSILPGILKTINPSFVCIAHDSSGIDFAPGIAALLDGACITGVEEIGSDNEGPWFGRQILSGKKIARTRPLKKPVILTIETCAFADAALGKKRRKRPEVLLNAYYEPVYHETGESPEAMAVPTALTDAEVIIAAGNGIGRKENLELVDELAGCFSRSAVAGSRIICDRGWLPYSRQVGETGATVRPRLYIACGISGASQHLAGMRGSELVVAVNTDPKAPICRAADICVIEDINLFLPELIQRLKEEKPAL